MSKRRKSRAGRAEAPVIPEITTEVLSKSYGDVTALAEVDIEIPSGQAVVLVGHNGSGKSTLLGLIAGTMEPTEGEVRIAGSEPDSVKARSRRSWLPDTPVLYDDLTVDEHLRYISRLHGGTGDEPRLEELVGASRPGGSTRPAAVAVQSRPAPEDRDRGRVVPAVLAAAGGRAVRRAGRARQGHHARPAQRGISGRCDPRCRDSRPRGDQPVRPWADDVQRRSGSRLRRR
ncbi:MAG: ATP-binding cassette domain-containing protein [Microthrixaceae bacterium]|nr:ATP-binding cassette domain-containing protein [Microthrixaceae bacterium]